MNSEQEIKSQFANFLINNLGYESKNLVFEKKIENTTIDLLIIDSEQNLSSTLAIVEFRNSVKDMENAIKQFRYYESLLNIPNIPCFLLNGIDLFVLQSYGWQRIAFIDFPRIEKLK
jgi:hypothetical protein